MTAGVCPKILSPQGVRSEFSVSANGITHAFPTGAFRGENSWTNFIAFPLKDEYSGQAVPSLFFVTLERKIVHDHAYRYLLNSLCDYLGCSQREEFLRTGLLTLDGVDTFLHHDESSMPDMLEIRFDCGPAPDECQKKVWHTLLVCNFATRPPGRRVFSVLPENGHAVLTVLYPLSLEVTGGQLAEFLKMTINDTKTNLEKIACDNPPSLSFLLGQGEHRDDHP